MLCTRAFRPGRARLVIAAWALTFCLTTPAACAADDAKPAADGPSSISKATGPIDAPAASPSPVTDSKAAADVPTAVPSDGAPSKDSKAASSTVLKQPSSEIAATAPPKAAQIPKAKRRGERDAIDTALATFESFCGEWQRMLRDREDNNLRKLVFLKKGEFHTAVYKGYGKIDACSCREVKGFAIGKLSYDEFDYYLVGKTTDDARHSKPQVSGSIRTTEIFRWERGKWFY
ncbi:MAG: hypothetical protein ACREQF_07870 [Candidatus Binataceae bacterium]